MSNWFKKLIDKIAKANGETFSGQKMDCCAMNRDNNGSKKK